MQYGLVFRRYAPFEEFGLGFEGDKRPEASTSLTATARTIGVVSFSPGNIEYESAFSWGTSYSGLGKKAERLSAAIARALGGSTSKVSASISVKTKTIEAISFTASTAGSNPFILGSPDIDTYIDFDALFTKTAIEFKGTVRGDNFPNAEVIVYDAELAPILLFHFETTGGKETGPITRLTGAHEKQILGNFQFRASIDASGNFLKGVCF